MMNSGNKATIKAVTKKATTKDSGIPVAAKTASNKVSSDKAYEEVQIGKQIWMTRNLNVDKFRNGDEIFNAKSKEEWLNASQNRRPSWCFYDFNEKKGLKLGKLYNFWAVNDARSIAPSGYRIPNDSEYKEAILSLGGKEEESYDEDNFEFNLDLKIKKKSEFMNLGGHCDYDGKFYYAGLYGYLWSSTEKDKHKSLAILIDDENLISIIDSPKDCGYSVRCIKI